jgi:hypothetical protein
LVIAVASWLTNLRYAPQKDGRLTLLRLHAEGISHPVQRRPLPLEVVDALIVDPTQMHMGLSTPPCGMLTNINLSLACYKQILDLTFR